MHQISEETAQASNGHRTVRSTNVDLSRAKVWAMAFLGLGLVACGGGGGGGGGSPAPTYTAATSDSFSPTTAKDKATKSKDVTLHWRYAVNNGLPISSTFSGATVSVSVTSADMTIDPADGKRRVDMSGPLSASGAGQNFSGNYSARIVEELLQVAGKTFFKSQAVAVSFNVAGGGQSAVFNADANAHGFSPDYEWILDRVDLDLLNVGNVVTVSSNGSADLKVTFTNSPPIERTNVAVAVNDVWTVLDKLPSIEVRGKTYNNVVKISRQTNLPDLSGNLTPVTMTYWVAKGIGMVKGEGIFRVLNVDNMLYELTDTNLSQ